MIAAGTEVYWTQTDWSGNAVRVIKTRTLGEPFRITRSDQQEIDLVNLTCLRCAPMSRISLTEPGVTIEKKPKGERQGVSPPCDLLSHDPGRAQDAPRGALRTVPKAETPKTTRRVDTLPLACETLAFDFMNLIVRAWHAGKPTETHAIRSMFQTVAAAVRALRPTCIVFALDGGHVHRSKMLPSYKAHRPPHDPNLVAQIKLAEQAIKAVGLNAVRVTNWEADDVLASIVERCANVVICSSDKDLLALHGRCRIYHPWGTGSFVDPDTKLGIPAGQVTDYLAMCGDASDGVPGVKGIGPKTAAELLTVHGSLESIIVAAKTGRIAGVTGKKIKDQTSAALLCQDVIQLRSSLPIPELPPWTPPAGWQTRLQSIGLGSVAAILESIHNVAITLRRDEPTATNATESKTTPVERDLSAATTQAEQVGKDESGRRGLPDSATLFDQQSQVEGRSEPAHTNGNPTANSTEDSRADLDTVARGNPVSGADNFITRSISEPIREGVPFIMRFADTASSMITYWEAGRRAAGRQPSVENPFKPTTPNAIAWQQGYEGYDLSVSLTDEPVVLNLKSETLNPQSPRSLF